MTRFLDTDDWQPDSEDSGKRTGGSASSLPSFLRQEPLDRPEPTDLTLHFHEVGPSFRPAGAPAPPSAARQPSAAKLPARPAASTPALATMSLPPLELPPRVPAPPEKNADSTREIALGAHKNGSHQNGSPKSHGNGSPPPPASASVAPGRAPALGYTSFHAAQPNTYELAPDSYLAAVEPLPPSSSLTPEQLAEAARVGRAWDPLVDPWPVHGQVDDIGAALLDHAARERSRPEVVEPAEVVEPTVPFEPAVPFGLGAFREALAAPSLRPGAHSGQPAFEEGGPDDDPERSPFEAVAYQPVIFSPAPYVPEHGATVKDDPAILTQPFDLSREHPSGPPPRTGVQPPAPVVPATPAFLTEPAPAPAGDGAADDDVHAVYDVSLTGPLGSVDLGFAGGHWYSVVDTDARPITVGDAIRSHPELAGQVVQVACWWMRENPRADRALDLATELAMAVSEIVRTHGPR